MRAIISECYSFFKNNEKKASLEKQKSIFKNKRNNVLTETMMERNLQNGL